MWARLIHGLILGAIGAGIVHIAIVFLVPGMSPQDAWSKLTAESHAFVVTPYETDSELAAQAGVADPYFRAVACRFDLTEGVARIKRQGTVPFWSASVYDRGGRNVYSLNDRSAREGQLDLVVLTPAQMIDMRKSPVEELQEAVFVEAPIDEGVVVVRAFAPDQSWLRPVADYLNAIECAPESS